MEKALIYALKERIGMPELFVGRREEIAYLLSWVEGIPREFSRSTALLSRRKKGKTALVERLYNLIFSQNGRVIPFFFEVKEGKKWVVDFAAIFYRTFISQYLGFKTREIKFCRNPADFDTLANLASQLALAEVAKDIRDFQEKLAHPHMVDTIWDHAQSAPHRLAGVTGDYFVQIIDEFQFLNSEIYWDQERTRVADDLAGSYLSLAESKIAPILATGSWVSWLKNIIHLQLPGRFLEMELGNLTPEEGLEAVLNYSVLMGIPVAKEVAVYLNELVDADPFYISAVIRSTYKKKDLTTVEGLLDTLEFELRRGAIYGTWLEYIGRTFEQVNSLNAKKIVLFLSENREREWTRAEIIKELGLPDSDQEAEKKLQMLVKGDLIAAGSTSIRYRGVQDEIFAKVFRYAYEEEIRNIPLEKTRQEEREKLLAQIAELKRKLQEAQGWKNYHHGLFLEYLLMYYLRFEGYKKEGARLRDKVYNYQEGAEFTPYLEVKKARLSLEGGREYEVDLWAKSFEPGQDLLISVKNLEKRVGLREAEGFFQAVEVAKRIGIKGYFLFYSASGFEEPVIAEFKQKGIMYADQESWAV